MLDSRFADAIARDLMRFLEDHKLFGPIIEQQEYGFSWELEEELRKVVRGTAE